MSLKLTKKIRGQMKAIKLFDNHQQEARKKGGSNPLNAVEKNSVSDFYSLILEIYRYRDSILILILRLVSEKMII